MLVKILTIVSYMFLGTSCLICITVLLTCFVLLINLAINKILGYNVYTAMAVVIDKEYVKAHTSSNTIVMWPLVLIPDTSYYEESYEVLVEFEGIITNYDDFDLYQQVEVGDLVPILVRRSKLLKKDMSYSRHFG